jgi:hypothetical protein
VAEIAVELSRRKSWVAMRLELLSSNLLSQHSRSNDEAVGQRVEVVHHQAAVATHEFRSRGTVAAKDSRKVGGRQVVLFEQEMEHFQWFTLASFCLDGPFARDVALNHFHR